jgi:BirA family biotin operon repressor/biotin-[acetyl-CoA-carboxylase] ligase
MPRRIVRFESITSTMHEAGRLAAEGCDSGTAVVADEQTAGLGRHGHSWHSERGAGLYVSVVLRHGPAPAVTLAMGLAAAEAIENTAGLRADLRWPNDLVLHGRKVAGILVESIPGALIVGVGVNVNHRAFPADIEHLATSLRIESGREQSREALLDTLLSWVDHYANVSEEDVIREFQGRSSYARGRRVVVDGVGEGVTDGLNEQGFLILRRADGSRATILAGGVRPA